MTAQNNIPIIAQHGTWDSPVTSFMLTESSIGLDEIRVSGDLTYWIENRPNDKGRCVIVCYNGNGTTDILTSPFSARSRTHEYGGGSYCCHSNDVYFVNDTDQDIYKIESCGKPLRITSTPDVSYADLTYDPLSRCIICVSEDRRNSETETVNTIIAVNIDTGRAKTICSGDDFYSNPRLSPCGTRLAYLCWNHPAMPWDNTNLYIIDFNVAITTGNKETVLAQDNISCFQPEWSPTGVLYFIADQTGWWNLYRQLTDGIEQITNQQVEFGLPQWVFSQSTYDFIDQSSIVTTYINNGVSCLATINLESLQFTQLNNEFSVINSLKSSNGNLWYIGASELSTPSIIHRNPDNNLAHHIKHSFAASLPHEYYSSGQTLSFPSRHGDTIHAIYYPPVNPQYTAPDNHLPPLIVLAHGGPTAMANTSLDIRKQYWTTRGFAIIDVNYSGSTGYGRDYRTRLSKQWGIRDAEDCCDAALYLADRGLVDPDRLIIKGSSAGGYTVLCALTFHDIFSAGASYYGIGSLDSLLQDTHKFESHYLDSLIGAYETEAGLYHARSPINFTQDLNCPVILLQGAEDRVVPKEQALSMYDALLKKGIPVTYLEFEGEQHGFRKAETIKKAIDSELAFYAAVFNMASENLIQIRIDNIDALSKK